MRGFRSSPQQLFRDYDFYAVQDQRRQRMFAAIDSAGSSELSFGDVDQIASRYADEFSLYAPVLVEGAVSVAVEEAQVDVTGNILYGYFGSGPNYVAGITVSYFVPFTGDSEMFRCRPSTFSLSPPFSELGDHELELKFTRPGEDIASTKSEFDRQLSEIKQSLSRLRDNCNSFNAALPSQARQQILQRRDRLSAMAQGTQSLGIAIRRTTVPPAIERVPAASTASVKGTKPESFERFDIALSFAGENRDYVEAVAKELRDAGVRIFYDKFETAALWGKNLVEHLAEIYGKRSRFVVIFISKEYVAKAWTAHERQHAQARALLAQEEYILPARFDDTEVPGMTTTVGYVDLRHTSSTDLASLIVKKLSHS